VTVDQEAGEDGRLARLVRDGLVRPRRTRPPAGLSSSEPPDILGDASAVEVLIEERREGR
jgi:hypothetical protein